MKRQCNIKKRIIIGITGSFGSGKTTVTRQFRNLGAKIIDADKIAHRVIRPGTRIYKRIVDSFGNDILKRNRTIDRNKLAGIVFNHKIALERLNRIMHPEVIRVIKKRIKTAHCELVVLDAPLLIESGLRDIVDKLIVVKTNREKQIGRIIKKTSLVRAEVLKRIGYQMSLKDKVRLADFVIDNSGTIYNTKKQTKKIIRRLRWKN
jgi:dephospho-CoA kinase